MIKNHANTKTRNRHSRRIPITSKFSPADLEAVQPKATAAGKTLSTYLRDSALSSTVQTSIKIPAINAEQWRELSKVTANLNQLAHRCHIGQEHPGSRQAQATLDALTQTLAEVRTALLGGSDGGAK